MGSVAFIGSYGNAETSLRILSESGRQRIIQGWAKREVAFFGSGLRWSPSGRYLLVIVRGSEHGVSGSEPPMKFENMYDDLAIVDMGAKPSPALRRLTRNAGWFDAKWKEGEDVIIAGRYPAGLNLEPENAGEWVLAAPTFRAIRRSQANKVTKRLQYAVSDKGMLLQMPGGLEVTGIDHALRPFLEGSATYASGKTSPLVQTRDTRSRRTWCQVAGAAFVVDDDKRAVIWFKIFEKTPFVRGWFGDKICFWHISLDHREVWILDLDKRKLDQVGNLPGSYIDADWFPTALKFGNG